MSKIDVKDCSYMISVYDLKSANNYIPRLCELNERKNCKDISNCYYKQLYKSREENKDLEFKYNMLARQYKKLQEQYQKVLKLAKENADASEFCLRELEKDYEKATQKLVDLGFWDVNGKYKEDYQLVENLEL